MLITRTPQRISIGGGGTDLPSYYRKRGGSLVAAAIDKYCYIAVNKTFSEDYLLKYSEIERVKTVEEIRHGLIREAFLMHTVEPSIEVVSIADLPSGTGLGSSGTFTVGLLRAIHALQKKPVQINEIAEEACTIEIDRLGEPVGKQDQYIAAFGGLTIFEFNKDDSVNVRRLDVALGVLEYLESNLLLFFTGYSRKAASILKDQQERTLAGDTEMLNNLDRTKELGFEIAEALEGGEVEYYGRLMHDHWIAKKARSAGMSNPSIDAWYEHGLSNGAIGGKLVGAGAGGFLLMLASDTAKLRGAMKKAGLPEVPFRFDHDGSIVMTRS
jgi:D-glycero-alpha-D-manno-heptose-7-phosphate kinase